MDYPIAEERLNLSQLPAAATTPVDILGAYFNLVLLKMFVGILCYFYRYQCVLFIDAMQRVSFCSCVEKQLENF